MIRQAEEVGLQTDINHAVAILQHYYSREPSIKRIQELVQDNPEFFGALLGDDKLDKAADRLEELIGGWKVFEALKGDAKP